MQLNRRDFVRLSLAFGAAAATPGCASAARHARPSAAELSRAASEPVLKVPSLKSPVTIES